MFINLSSLKKMNLCTKQVQSRDHKPISNFGISLFQMKYLVLDILCFYGIRIDLNRWIYSVALWGISCFYGIRIDLNRWIYSVALLGLTEEIWKRQRRDKAIMKSSLEGKMSDM